MLLFSYFAISLCRNDGGAYLVETDMSNFFGEDEEEFDDDFSDSDGYLSEVRTVMNSLLCGPAH